MAFNRRTGWNIRAEGKKTMKCNGRARLNIRAEWKKILWHLIDVQDGIYEQRGKKL